MKRFLQLVCGLAVLGTVSAGLAFSLLGPLKDGGAGGAPPGGGAGGGAVEGWQAAGYGGLPQGLGYTLANDIGGPMFLHEAYRCNIPTLMYAFDESFVRYFGTNGIFAVQKAFAILNALPPVSAMSADLSEFPEEETREVNNLAQALGMHDVKSLVLAIMMEQLGLANPQRFVWGLRSRYVLAGATNYTVVPMNYDPVTYTWSPYINGVLYAYRVIEPLGAQGAEYASAVEIALGNAAFVDKRTPLAARFHSPDLLLDDQGLGLEVPISTTLLAGHTFTGLTRDDVGGLRFLLLSNNIVTETLATNVVAENPFLRAPWTPIIGGITNYGSNAPLLTNFVGALTNLTNFINQGMRGGIGKVSFQQVNYDSLIGLGFVTVTNKYTDYFYTNGAPGNQQVQRLIVEPDILFLAEDLGAAGGPPLTVTRTDTTGWVNNNALNGRANAGGPGVIVPPIQIRLTDNAPFFYRSQADPNGNHLDVPFVWASFEATTTEPIVYPQYLHYSVTDIADQVLGTAEGPPFP
jgi:hypothetical protein